MEEIRSESQHWLRREKPEREGKISQYLRLQNLTFYFSGKPGVSLAFTLVYDVPVFSVTLLYMGLQFARRWHDTQNRASLTAWLGGV